MYNKLVKFSGIQSYIYIYACIPNTINYHIYDVRKQKYFLPNRYLQQKSAIAFTYFTSLANVRLYKNWPKKERNEFTVANLIPRH